MSALNEQNVCPKSHGHDALASALKKEKARNPACLLAFWRSGWDSNPRAAQHRKLISSQSRYPDFEGKRRKLTDNARVCKPLKNQHFSALEG